MAKIDAPIGRPDAPPGSVDRANWVRSQLQTLAEDLPKTPAEFSGWWKEIMGKYPDPSNPKRRVFGWALLNDDTGSPFKTIEDFCAFRLPWGLGKPKKDLDKFVKALEKRPDDRIVPKLEIDHARELALAGATDRRALNGKNRGENGFVSDSGQDGTNQTASDEREAKRLRAIGRAPDPIPYLYTADLVSKTVAESVGGADAAVGAAAEAVIRERGAPTNDTEKRETRRLVDAAVRETAGVTKPTHTLATITTIFRAWWATASQADRDVFVVEVSHAARSTK